MKILSIILLVILIFNSVFYYISLDVRIIVARFDASQAHSERTTLIKLASKDAKGIEEKELWYNDKLYDIASSKIINDTVYYYALEDHEEEEAISISFNHFNTEPDSISLGNSKVVFHKMLVRGSDQYCFNFYKYSLFQNSSLRAFKMPDKSCSIGSHKVLTPPPRTDC